MKYDSAIKTNEILPWLMWLSRLEHHPTTKRLQIQFPVRAHTSIAGLIHSPGAYYPWSRHAQEATGLCLTLSQPCFSLSLLLSLKAMKICPWEIKNKE